jgi:hypothetical protein
MHLLLTYVSLLTHLSLPTYYPFANIFVVANVLMYLAITDTDIPDAKMDCILTSLINARHHHLLQNIDYYSMISTAAQIRGSHQLMVRGVTFRENPLQTCFTTRDPTIGPSSHAAGINSFHHVTNKGKTNVCGRLTQVGCTSHINPFWDYGAWLGQTFMLR